MERRFIVGKGDHRLNTVVPAFVKDFVIEGQPFLIGFGIISVGKDSAPGNGKPQHLESHLRHQSNIFLIPVIKVDTHQFEIVGRRPFRERAGYAVRHHILNGKAFAAFVICTLALIGRDGAAP